MDYDATLLSNIRRYIVKNNKLTQHELSKLRTETQNQLQTESLNGRTLPSEEPENNSQVHQPDISDAIPTQCENNIDQQEKMGVSARHPEIDTNQVPSTETLLGDGENTTCRGECDSENDTNNEIFEIAEEIMKKFHIVKETNINERESIPKIANSTKSMAIIEKGNKALERILPTIKENAAYKITDVNHLLYATAYTIRS